jgi:NMD protein affecting ribosome stability and mRNA decay
MNARISGKYKKPQAHRVSKYQQTLENQSLIICPTCHNVFYKKSWHQPEQISSGKGSWLGQKGSFKSCPACIMTKGGTFEGEIRISNVPAKFQKELEDLVHNFNSRAQMSDPQDRVISVKKQGSGFRINMTENQSAVRLAKKIRDSFKGSKLSISYSKEPNEVSYSQIIFPKK